MLVASGALKSSHSIMIDDALLLQKIQFGGLEADRAMRQLLDDRVVRGRLWRLVVERAGGSADDAAEVLQTAAVRFYEAVLNGKFDGRSQTRTFFIGFIEKRTLEWLRQRGKTKLVDEARFFDRPEDALAFDAEKSALDAEADFANRRSALADVFQKLTEKCRKALSDRYFELKEYEAIRLEFDYKTIQQARDKVYECRQRLRQILLENPRLRTFLRETR